MNFPQSAKESSMTNPNPPNEKHLEFLQNAITRLGTNSFQIKGVAIALISALVGFYANGNNSAFLVIAFFVTLIFWLLNAYYLQQERKLRGVYNYLIGIRNPDMPEDLEIQDFAFPLNKFEKGQYGYWKTFWSKPHCILYGPIGGLEIVFIIWHCRSHLFSIFKCLCAVYA
jgi:hypothetical protein